MRMMRSSIDIFGAMYAAGISSAAESVGEANHRLLLLLCNLQKESQAIKLSSISTETPIAHQGRQPFLTAAVAARIGNNVQAW